MSLHSLQYSLLTTLWLIRLQEVMGNRRDYTGPTLLLMDIYRVRALCSILMAENHQEWMFPIIVVKLTGIQVLHGPHMLFAHCWMNMFKRGMGQHTHLLAGGMTGALTPILPLYMLPCTLMCLRFMAGWGMETGFPRVQSNTNNNTTPAPFMSSHSQCLGWDLVISFLFTLIKQCPIETLLANRKACIRILACHLISGLHPNLCWPEGYL